MSVLVFRFWALGILVSSVMSLSAAAEVEEITVTATRLPLQLENVAAAVSVVTLENSERQRAGFGIDEALQATPGLYTQNRQNFAQDLRVSLRGFGARSSFGIRGVTLLLDGVPVSLPDGQGQVDLIDPADIGRVEVLRGASGLLYGNGAGGVINFISRENTLPLSADMAVGSDGFSRLQLGLTGGDETLAYGLRLGTFSNDGFREYSRSEQHRLRAHLNWRPSRQTTVNVKLIATDQPIAEDPGAITRTTARDNTRAARDRNRQFAADESQDQQRLQLSVQHSFANQSQFLFHSYYQDQDFANHLPFEFGGAVQFDRLHFGSSLLWASGASDDAISRWLIGLDIGRQKDDRMRFDNLMGDRGDLRLAQTEKVHTTGVFVQRNFDLADHVLLSAGLRHDALTFDIDDGFLADGVDSGSRSLSQWSPRLALSYRPNVTYQWFLNLATSYESPTSTEFAIPAGGGFNPNLEAATTRSIELGWRATLRAHQLEVALFDISVTNELVGFELEAQPGRTFFANAGESERHGFEFAASGSPTDRLSYRFAYSFSQFRFLRFLADANDFSGMDMPGQPRHRGGFVLNWKATERATLSADIVHTGSRYANNANSERVNSHTIMNIRGGFSMDRPTVSWDIFAGINNVSDQTYTDNLRINAFGGRFFEPGPGRHYYLGLRWRRKNG